jgi:flagellum-specific ATP synthase
VVNSAHVTASAARRVTQEGLSELEQELARASFGPLAADDDAEPTIEEIAAQTIVDLADMANNPYLDGWRAQLEASKARSQISKPLRACGRLTRAAGLVLEAVGLKLGVGSECMIELPAGSSIPMAEAEVVGFSGDKLFLMPTTEVSGLLPGARVYPLESAPINDPMAGAKRLPVGWEMLGRVVDASGKPLDGLGPLGSKIDAPLTAPTINPLNRDPQSARCRRARDQRVADRGTRPAHGPVRGLGRRQVRAAWHHGALYERRSDRDRADW